ncbi:MAG: riboflavin synthase [Eubacteriales bacterium]|nr:riboflavin synthase [Eubacteriales bacterium]
MFTGIVEETGKVLSVNRGGGTLTIKAENVLRGTRVGDSIAVNGVCLTVTSLGNGTFTADVMPETLNRSSLGTLKAGISVVNLERAMELGGRFGGHIVSGHIDGTGKISELKADGNAVWYTIEAGSSILKYVIEKGSITIDGISLTVAAVGHDSFSVSVIPHTRQVTALSQRKAGDIVNLENDCIGKYVERLLSFSDISGGRADSGEASANEVQESQGKKENGISREFLAKYGF